MAPHFYNTRACKVSITVDDVTSSPPEVAKELFAPIALTYERSARFLSMGQDARWRQTLVDGLKLPNGSRVLDVAAGTGSISRLMESQGLEVLSLDQSPEMIAMAERSGATAVLATAETLPFADETFDGVTFGYLLRYVDDVPGCLRELVRVVRPGESWVWSSSVVLRVCGGLRGGCTRASRYPWRAQGSDPDGGASAGSLVPASMPSPVDTHPAGWQLHGLLPVWRMCGSVVCRSVAGS